MTKCSTKCVIDPVDAKYASREVTKVRDLPRDKGWEFGASLYTLGGIVFFVVCARKLKSGLAVYLADENGDAIQGGCGCMFGGCIGRHSPLFEVRKTNDHKHTFWGMSDFLDSKAVEVEYFGYKVNSGAIAEMRQ